MKEPKTLTPAKTVQEVFAQIRKIISEEEGQVISRGESSKKHNLIFSSLAREYFEKLNLNAKQLESFDLEKAQKQRLDEQIKLYTDLETEEEILSEVRHYGGWVTLIDFTYDYNVALFFACNDKLEEDGRVIFVNTSLPKLPEDIKMFAPKKKLSIRITSQKSVFLRPSKRNHIYQKDGEDFITIVPIPKELKRDVMLHLAKHHDIKTSTVYRDVFGYVQNQSLPENAEFFFYQGFFHASQGANQAAIGAYRQSIDRDPNNPLIYNNLGVVYAELKSYDSAISCFRKTLALDPNFKGAHNNLGSVYFNLEKYDTAIENYNRAIELERDDPDIYINRGNAHRALENHIAAKEDYQTAFRLAKQQGNESLAATAQLELNNTPAS